MSHVNVMIDRAGYPVANGWTILADEQELPASGPVIVPLARLLADADAVLALPGGVGVLLAPADSVDAVLPLLSRMALVAVSFPKFRDGRGFSQIRMLNERRDAMNWRGEIRAVGDVLPDQFLALVRCGVSTVQLAEGEDPAEWRAVLASHGGDATQPLNERPLPLLRRLAAPLDV